MLTVAGEVLMALVVVRYILTGLVASLCDLAVVVCVVMLLVMCVVRSAMLMLSSWWLCGVGVVETGDAGGGASGSGCGCRG